MDSILFLCSDYYSDTHANGICIRNLVKETQARGIKAYVITESVKTGMIEKRANLEVYGVKKTWFAMLSAVFEGQSKWKQMVYDVFRMVRGIFAAVLFPNVSPLRSQSVYRYAYDLVKKNHIETVVCSYRPFESLQAGMKLKNNIHDLFVAGYHLDLLTSPNNSSVFIRNYKIFRANRFFEKEKDCFDFIILPTSAKTKGEGAEDKICYADFPLFVLDDAKETNGFEYEQGVINLCYIGSIDGENRTIDYPLLVLKKAQEILHRRIKLNIWGKVTLRVQKQLQESGIAEYHGVVENRYTEKILEDSDFVVNISNRITPTMVPSKIFQLFSSRKPIINFVESPEDASLPYFAQNTFACNVYDFEVDTEKEAQKIAAFVLNFAGKKQSEEFVEQTYRKSKPSYVLDLIEKHYSV